MDITPLGQKADDVASVIVEEINAGEEFPPDDLLRAVIERLSAALLIRCASNDGAEMMDKDYFQAAATTLMQGAAQQILRAFDMADYERRKTDAL